MTRNRIEAVIDEDYCTCTVHGLDNRNQSPPVDKIGFLLVTLGFSLALGLLSRFLCFLDSWTLGVFPAVRSSLHSESEQINRENLIRIVDAQFVAGGTLVTVETFGEWCTVC